MNRVILVAAYLAASLLGLFVLHFLGGRMGGQTSFHNALLIAAATPVYGLHLMKGESMIFGSLTLAITAFMLVGVPFSIVSPGLRSALVGGLGFMAYWLLTIFFLLIHV